jgi:S-adenosylmethionine:tRNA ribosyltransferase-isomerase
MTATAETLAFALPDERVAHEPPEARGLARDAVRLMVSRAGDGFITHTRFFNLPSFLAANDVLVVNTSATIHAALEAVREARSGDPSEIVLHLSTPLSRTRWVIELRRRTASGTQPLLDASAGERIGLRGGGTATLLEPYVAGGAFTPGRHRLWIARFALRDDVLVHAGRHGSPIRYSYVPRAWPLAYYQTIFAKEPGSAEMPSAARAFTRTTLDRLHERGVRIAPLVLHTGVSSLDADEPPYPERYRVPAATARLVNQAREAGGRVVAVGTTTVRALETVARGDGAVRAGRGWTDLVITPERGLRVVAAVLTGLHGPDASHLALLETLAGRAHVARAYASALRNGYLWHEFGDLHLMLP